jgi:hypothetical protein
MQNRRSANARQPSPTTERNGTTGRQKGASEGDNSDLKHRSRGLSFNEDEADNVDADQDEGDDADDEEDDADNTDDEEPPAAGKAALYPLSPLQSRRGSQRRGVFIPEWVMAITNSDAEQKLLGLVDYWLGIVEVKTVGRRQKVQLRARGKYLYVEGDGTAWYAATCRQMGWQLSKSKAAVRGLVRSLAAKGFLLKACLLRRDKSSALCLRINWPLVEKAYIEARPHEEEDGYET